MTLFDELKTDINGILSYGSQVRLKHYTGSVSDTDFDDAQKLTQSGTDVWASGLMFPVKSTFGSQEALLIEQGKIESKDKKIFVRGDIETTDTMKIGIGSPPSQEYALIPDGIIAYPPFGDIVYKKMYVRLLPTGSLIGEY